MTDGDIILAITLAFWFVVVLWIKGTDPLAGPIVRTVWFIVKWTVLIVFGVGVLLALTGMSGHKHNK